MNVLHAHLSHFSQPGTDIPVVACQECNCTQDVDPKTQFYKINCGLVQCNEKCDPVSYMTSFSSACLRTESNFIDII